MNTTMKSSGRMAPVLLAIGISLSGCAGLATAPSPQLHQQIEGARTPADHTALSTHYTQEAATARSKAAEHRQMARRYQAAPTMGRGNMPSHCNAVANSYDAIAMQFDEMATSHRQMAEQAKR